MSSSLSRLAGKLVKDKLCDSPAITLVDAVEDSTRALQQPSNVIPTATSTELMRLKKENNSREKHSKRHSAHVVKGKQKSEKPDRECSIM